MEIKLLSEPKRVSYIFLFLIFCVPGFIYLAFMILYAFRVLVTCVGFIIPAFPHSPNSGVPAFLCSTVPGLSISRGNMSLNTEIRAGFFECTSKVTCTLTAKNSGVSS